MTYFVYALGLTGFVLALSAYADVAKLKQCVAQLEARRPRA